MITEMLALGGGPDAHLCLELSGDVSRYPE